MTRGGWGWAYGLGQGGLQWSSASWVAWDAGEGQGVGLGWDGVSGVSRHSWLFAAGERIRAAVPPVLASVS